MVKIRRLQDSESGDYILLVSGLSFQERENVIGFLEQMEKNSKEEMKKNAALAEHYPDQKQLGQAYIVPSGVYNGMTIENVFAEYGFEGLADIISAAPRVDGNENVLLHGISVNYAINIANEAILYYYNIVDETSFTDAKKIASYCPLMKLTGFDPDLDIEIVSEDPEKWLELQLEIMGKFNEFTTKFACDIGPIKDLDDYILQLPENWQNANTSVMRMGNLFQNYGEAGLVSLMVSSINKGDIQQVKKIVEYLKCVHKFKGFLNVDQLTKIYQCKNISPDEIIPAIDKRLDKAVMEMEKVPTN